MYSIGLVRFSHKKQFNLSKALEMFFAKHAPDIKHNKPKLVNNILADDKNFTKFAAFVDKSLKDGSLKGKPVRLNYSYEEAEMHRVKAEAEKKALNKEELLLWNLIKKYDDPTRLSKCTSFFNKKGMWFPPNNDLMVSRVGKNLPKLLFMINSGYFEELKSFLTGRTPEDQAAYNMYKIEQTAFGKHVLKFEHWKESNE